MIRSALVTAVAAAVWAVGALPAAAAPGDVAYAAEPDRTWSVSGGQVYAMLRLGDKVLLGGSFNALRSPGGRWVARSRLAMVDARTGAPASHWNASANGTVRALATDGRRIFAGGSFTAINGVGKLRLASLTVTTGVVNTAFTAQANGEVRSLLLAFGKLYAGGLFTTINGKQRVRLAAVSPASGVLDTKWRPTASWAVNSMTPVPGTTVIAIGGEFSTITGAPRRYLGMVERTSGAVKPWMPPPDCVNATNPCVVRAVAATSTMVYAAVGGIGGRLSAYDTSTAARRWSQYGDGDVQSVAIIGGTVYAGGHFSPLFGRQDGVNLSRSGIAALDAASGRLQAFSPEVTGGSGVWTLLAEPDGLRIAGAFTAVNGLTTRKGYSSFPIDSLAVR